MKRLVLSVALGALVTCGGSPSAPEIVPDPTVPESFQFPPAPATPTSNFLDDRLAKCPTAAEIASVADIPLTFDTSARATALVCFASDGSADLTEAQERALWSLILVKDLQFDKPLPWTSKTLYDWLRDAVRGFAIFGTSGTNSCCDVSRVPLIYLGDHPGTLNWISTETLTGGLIHEARHAEGFRHTCGLLDNLVSDLGAFGVQDQYYFWIGTHSSPSVVPEGYRPYALWLACTVRNSAFCLEPKKDCR